MTSKIVVNNIESDSGIGSVTFTSDIELGTKNLKGHNLESTGIVTATSFSGSGASLTSLPAGNLTGTLPAIDGSNLTGVGASFGNSSVNTSGIITATAFVSSQGQLSHRNIIINGAMTLAQRGSSSTSDGFHTVDRFAKDESGTDESLTQAQVDVASGTTPYTLGFRKAFKLTNGNQTSGAGSADRATAEYKIEAQDIATSGWNYLSSSSYITFSYWVKSSVAQNFYNTFGTDDGTKQRYTTETGSLTADTWTKITKTIPGNSNLTFNNDNGEGLEITWEIYRGTSQTGSMSLNAWAASNNNLRTPDQTSTWWTTNDATFEITGVQLEVGPVATPFEHRKFSEQLLLCQRYYRVISDSSEDGNGYVGYTSYNYDVNSVVTQVNFIPEMRATPTIASTSGTNYYRYYRNSGYVDINAMNAINGMGRKGGAFNNSDSGNGTAGQAGGFVLNNSSAKIAFDAEL